jgi:hypothetical protein
MIKCQLTAKIGILWLLFGAHDQPDQSTEMAIKRIRELGGVISSYGKMPAHGELFAVCQSPQFSSAKLKLLVNHLAQLNGVRGVDLSYNSYITDEVLGELPYLKELQYLALRSDTISDAGFKAIAKLKRLEVLDLNGAKIAETGLKRLAGLEQLQVLGLDWTDMKASAVKELAPLRNLKHWAFQMLQTLS